MNPARPQLVITLNLLIIFYGIASFALLWLLLRCFVGWGARGRQKVAHVTVSMGKGSGGDVFVFVFVLQFIFIFVSGDLGIL